MTITKILKFLEKYSEKTPNVTLDNEQLSFNVYRKGNWVNIVMSDYELNTHDNLLEKIETLLKD